MKTQTRKVSALLTTAIWVASTAVLPLTADARGPARPLDQGEQILLTIASDHPEYKDRKFILKLFTDAQGDLEKIALDKDQFTVAQVESDVGAVFISRYVFLAGTWNVLRIKAGRAEDLSTTEEFPKMKSGTEKIDRRHGGVLTLTYLHEKAGLKASKYKHLELELARDAGSGEWTLLANENDGRKSFRHLFVEKRADGGNGIQTVKPMTDPDEIGRLFGSSASGLAAGR